MISILNTIPPTKPFNYEQQGLYGNYQAGSPVADYSRLIPFISMPFNIIENSVVVAVAYLTNICGNLTYKVPVDVPSIIKNNKMTFHWPVGMESGLTNIPAGYYYLDCGYHIPPSWANRMFDDYKNRVLADGGTIEAEQCLIDQLARYSGGIITGELFKTEVFKVLDSATEPIRKGSFNQSFSTAFDV